MATFGVRGNIRFFMSFMFDFLRTILLYMIFTYFLEKDERGLFL